MAHLGRRAFLGAVTLALAGCAVAPGPEPVDQRVTDLTAAILALGPVDAEEAARAARIAVHYPLDLRRDYGVTDPPLVHNTKVNLGLRPRGLCWHWADDLEARLRAEAFQTLVLHRAIANATSVLIDHSTVVISARGAEMEQGLVLDPWRYGGDLFWSKVAEDPRYEWQRRAQVMARRR